MRNRMANDMMEAVNLTHRVERAVLEQKLEDAEQNLAIRDLKLDWMSFKTVYGRDDLDSNDHVADPALTGQYINKIANSFPGMWQPFSLSISSKHKYCK